MTIAFPFRFTPEPGEPGVYNVQGLAPWDNVITYGESFEEAKAMAREALTGVIGVVLDHGDPAPRPVAEAEGDDIHWIEPEPEVALPLQLRWVREDAKLTQAEVAQRMGVAQQAVQRLEGTRSNPTVKTLARFARATGRELKVGF